MPLERPSPIPERSGFRSRGNYCFTTYLQLIGYLGWASSASLNFEGDGFDMQKRIFALGVLSAGAAFASGTGGGGVTPAGSAEVRTLSERVPAGGTVQVKYLLTQPRPITTTGPTRLMTYDFAVDGVSAFSPMGDTAGAALMQSGSLSVSIISPNSDFGTNLDYPFLTVALTIPPTTLKGSTFSLGMADATFQTPSGPLTLVDSKPGVLTIGGSVSIYGVTPGGGTWAAGTVIRVAGTGFVPGTKLTTKMRTTNAVYVSATEMRFSLLEATTLDTQPITAGNPDGSLVTFYSYLRGVPVYRPSLSLLRKTDPIFQAQTHGVATVGPIGNLTPGQFTALAIQNPTPGPVVVTFLHEASGVATTITLPSCGRVMDELGTLLGGLILTAGDRVTVTATSGVQILGLLGDDTAGTMTPFLPAF